MSAFVPVRSAVSSALDIGLNTHDLMVSHDLMASQGFFFLFKRKTSSFLMDFLSQFKLEFS